MKVYTIYQCPECGDAPFTIDDTVGQDKIRCPDCNKIYSEEELFGLDVIGPDEQ
jgi:DNA-directed RNA polymerase subunit RPC12/RpoP